MIYTNENRGQIQNEEKARQLIEFTEMKFGSATPTDIDGFIEIHNEAFIVFEIKHRNASLPEGQKMALMRLVDNLSIAGKKSVLFVAKHSVEDEKKNIKAAETEVTDVYFNGIWHKVHGNNLKEMTKKFIKWAIPFY